MKKLSLILSTALVSLTLAACGGGDDEGDATKVVPTAATLPASPTTTAAAATLPFSFPSGVPALGTTASTSVTFTNTATAPAFTIASGTNTASGTTTFGSCIFAITQSTFPATSPLGAGKTIRVDPCNFRAETSGMHPGRGEQRGLALILGAAFSAGVPVTMEVNEGGQLTVNGKSAGTVTLVPVTGA